MHGVFGANLVFKLGLNELAMMELEDHFKLAITEVKYGLNPEHSN